MGKMFVVIFWGGTYFCRLLEKSQKSQKLQPIKILCYTVVFALEGLFCYLHVFQFFKDYLIIFEELKYM